MKRTGISPGKKFDRKLRQNSVYETAEKHVLKNRGFSRLFLIAEVRPSMQLSNTAKNRVLKNRGFSRLSKVKVKVVTLLLFLCTQKVSTL
jgi:hypothetical protein